MSQGRHKPSAGPKGFGPGGGPGGPGAMGRPVQKAKDFKGTLKRLSRYLAPFKLQLIAVFATALLSTLFMILSPAILGNATTELFRPIMTPGAAINFDYILQILAVLAVLYLLSSVFSYLQQYIMAGVSQKTVYAMRKEVNDKLSRLPLKFYDSHSHGDILSRVTNDMDNISSTMQQSLTQLITSVVTLVGVIIMMLWISPLMTLILILTLPLSFIAIRKIAARSQVHFASQQKELGALNGHVEEMYTGHKVIKAYGRERSSIAEFNGINEKLYDAGWKAQFISGIIMPVMMFIGNIGYVLVCVVGGIMVAQQTLQIGHIQAFIQYSRQFTQPITQTANIANILQSTMASAERVFELLDEQEEVPESAEAGKINTSDLRGNVKFEHVRFGYKKEAALIEDMNLDVKQGQTVAIVGPTGAGKTTLINLLMRFYELDGGKITIDGVNIAEMKRGELRSLFGMVLQDTWLFNGTIRDNIAYGKAAATDEEVYEAARTAYADHFIRTLPDGYDTILNEEASNISQGQKQLLTIARAILADPAILILDEATSSVDTRTEVHIQQAMNELMKGRTSFVIAHRLSTIKGADRILVMKDGSIIEQGNHEELISAGGFYADLYYSQFAAKAVG
ncbi:ABC transporter ATP-binding protein [Paenibacillus senegalensis]|uniref:ABC transporter ATP-binding protein n=1 Tax=Paenibacillus senegalensis TaxID=1465766 RepID=UPI0002898683|nr:ABC transporter ATP-binding protein [Paenibacillus senegalensis]